MSHPLERIVENNVAVQFPVCNNCVHKLKGLKCAAFDVIPDVILLGENDHSKPLPEQQNDIVFKEKEADV